MKLTNYHRDAFVLGVMNDLPDNRVDEIVHGELKAIIDKHLPKAVLEMLQSEKLQHYLGRKCIVLPLGITNFNYPIPDELDYWYEWLDVVAKEVRVEVEAVIAKGNKLVNERLELQEKLKSAIKSVSTVKQALAFFPEFAKYLPTETELTKNLPAVQNLVANLNEAGWPKERKPAAKKLD